MKSDFSDLRFTNAAENALLDAWMESHTASTSAVIWVETNTPANNVDADIYMYYGNSGAASGWDIGATFVLGDDFNDASIDTGIWTVIGSPVESGGTLTTINNSDYIKSTQTFGQNYALRSRSYFHASNYSTLGFRNGPGNNVALEFLSNYPNANDVKAFQYDTAWENSTDLADPAVWGIYDIIRNGNTSGIYNINDVHKSTLTAQLTPDSLPVTGFASIIMDWIVVRKYAANPPTYAFGVEQSVPAGNPHWYWQMLKRRN